MLSQQHWISKFLTSYIASIRLLFHHHVQCRKAICKFMIMSNWYFYFFRNHCKGAKDDVTIMTMLIQVKSSVCEVIGKWSRRTGNGIAQSNLLHVWILPVSLIYITCSFSFLFFYGQRNSRLSMLLISGISLS